MSKKTDRKSLAPESFYLQYQECPIDPEQNGTECPHVQLTNGTLFCGYANVQIDALDGLCGVMWKPEILHKQLIEKGD